MSIPARAVRRRFLRPTCVLLALAFSAALVGHPAHGQPAPGLDVRVNNVATDTDDTTTQSETTLAVRGTTICAGFNDSGPDAGASALARSGDLGGAWVDQGELGAAEFGDAALAVHRVSGTFYYAELATIGGNSAIGVARSTDDCRT